jgi:hypothetical protein
VNEPKVRVVDVARCPLRPDPLGPGYSGPETYRTGGDFATADGALAGGVWAYDGTLHSDNPGAGHQLWLVLSGTIELELEDERHHAEAGQLLLLEAPYPGKTLRTSPDFRAVWLGVPRAASG